VAAGCRMRSVSWPTVCTESIGNSAVVELAGP
jgi:hypothetical protein